MLDVHTPTGSPDRAPADDRRLGADGAAGAGAGAGAGTAADGSRLVAAVGEAERAERTRLADALHDDVLQNVLAARQDLVELQALPGGPELGPLAGAVEEIERSLRSLTLAMHEDTLERLPLEEALVRIAEGTARRGRFAVDVRVDPRAAGVHDALVRGSVRELLTNVLKHANARHAELVVRDHGTELEIEVADDGRGLHQDAIDLARLRGHLGLARLQRTVEELGGRTYMEAREGGGTRSIVRLPRVALEHQATLEQQLGAERRWSTALVAALQDALVVVRGGRYVQVNDAFVALTGHPRSAILGLRTDEAPFLRPCDRATNNRYVETSEAQRGSQVLVTFTHADGHEIEVQATSQRIDDDRGAALGVLWLVRDLTERRQAEERRRLQQELETTIETTRRLTRLVAAGAEGIPAVVEQLGRLLVEHLGWRDAIINLCEDGAYRAAWSARGMTDPLVGERYDDHDLAPYVTARFARVGGAVFFVPEEDGPGDTGASVAVPPPGSGDCGAARPGDLLLVPLRAADGRRVGLISVDAHASGRRPTPTQLEVLAAVAAHAAIALDLL